MLDVSSLRLSLQKDITSGKFIKFVVKCYKYNIKLSLNLNFKAYALCYFVNCNTFQSKLNYVMLVAFYINLI